MKFSSAPNTSVQQVPQPPISKTVPTLFQKNISNSRSGSTKWQISSQLPPQFFKISLRDTPSHIFILPLGFRPLSEFCLIFSQTCATIVGKVFKILNFQITGKCIYQSKNNQKETFLLMESFTQNFPPGSYLQFLGRGK